uniref:Uncharacterized protein n=1 Tax=Kalanchoe fedtschenkoi TaxID=63787 RepID=A0A7N0TJC9_KALFE
MRISFWRCWGLMLAFSLHFAPSAPASHVYIAYLGLSDVRDPRLTSQSHAKILSYVFSSEEDAKRSMLYSYSRSFSGFAAALNSSQADALAKMKGVISVFRSRSSKLHTTRSWDFMGLNLHKSYGATPTQLAYGSDVVVGVFDTGVWPEARSFQDDSKMGPVPSSWRGNCVKGDQFDPVSACNKKLIGARFYVKGFEQEYGPLNSTFRSEYRSARDFLGHGTHTASTAVGSVATNASFLGFGLGAARGGAPLARLAVYKVCWSLNSDGVCTEADILAAFDEALHDGVHIISASFGGTPPLAPFIASSADIGSFHAMQMGVSVVFSAGNDGPGPSLVQNVAPWSICVAASSIDRAFPAKITLDTNLTITGQGLIRKKVTGKLVSATAYFAGGVCSPGNWNERRASGRIILCFSTIGPLPSSDVAVEAARQANATALIYVEPLTRQIADVDLLPTIRLDFHQGTKLDHYLGESPKLPVVRISPAVTVNGKTPAPAVAYFSSRGPSSVSPDILKVFKPVSRPPTWNSNAETPDLNWISQQISSHLILP